MMVFGRAEFSVESYQQSSYQLYGQANSPRPFRNLFRRLL